MMNRFAVLLSLAIALACGACASNSSGVAHAPPPEAPPSAEVSTSQPPVADGSQEIPAAAGGTSGPAGDGRSQEVTPISMPARPQEETDIWTDPRFRRRFIESYLSETEIEPRVTANESEPLTEIYDLITAEKLDEAAALIIEERTPTSSAHFDYLLGNIYRQQEKLDQAVAEYKKAIDKFPKFRRAWQNLAQTYYHQGHFKSVVYAYAKMLELGEGNAFTYGILGVAHSNLENYLAAETAFRMANLLDPDNLDWKLGMAKALVKQQRFAESIAAFQSLIDERPDTAELWLAQGEAYYMLQQPTKAAENFEMVDRLGGSSFRSLNNLGDIYANSKHYDLAVSAYDRALRKFPDAKLDRIIRAARYIGRNGAHTETKLLLDGIEEVRGATLDEDVRKQLLHLRARVAEAEELDAEQAATLKRIVDIDPLDGDALIKLGQNAGRTGDSEQAVFYFERAANIEGFEARAKLRHAELLARDGKYKEAYPLIQRAYELEPRETVRTFMEQVEKASKR